jgi:hypothetical protein
LPGVPGRAGEPEAPKGGLLQTARAEEEEEGKEEQVVGGVKSRPEVTEEEEADAEVDARDAVTETRCARRVSRARPELKFACLGGTTVDPDSQEVEEEREP